MRSDYLARLVMAKRVRKEPPVELAAGHARPHRASRAVDHGAAALLRARRPSRSGRGPSADAQPGHAVSALVRLEQKRWIKGSWQRTETHRDAKYYAITKSGTRALSQQTERWRRLAGLVGQAAHRRRLSADEAIHLSTVIAAGSMRIEIGPKLARIDALVVDVQLLRSCRSRPPARGDVAAPAACRVLQRDARDR